MPERVQIRELPNGQKVRVTLKGGITYRAHRRSAGDWVVIEKPFDSPNGRIVSTHKTKAAAVADAKKRERE